MMDYSRYQNKPPDKRNLAGAFTKITNKQTFYLKNTELSKNIGMAFNGFLTALSPK